GQATGTDSAAAPGGRTVTSRATTVSPDGSSRRSAGRDSSPCRTTTFMAGPFATSLHTATITGEVTVTLATGCAPVPVGRTRRRTSRYARSTATRSPGGPNRTQDIALCAINRDQIARRTEPDAGHRARRDQPRPDRPAGRTGRRTSRYARSTATR